MATVAMFTACGGGKRKDKSNTEDIVAEKVNSFSQKAAENSIKAIGGMSLASFAPEWKYEVDESTMTNYGDSNHGSILFQKHSGESLSDEEYDAWIKKVYEATKAVSDNKMNIYGYESKSKKEEAMTEWKLDEILNQTGFMAKLGNREWGFVYKGSLKRVRIERWDNKKFDDKVISGVEIDVANALQKSFDDTMKDAEKALEDPEVQKALKKMSK
ncbi:MAG: hypothetical protein Q4F97_06590 [Bacteroidales bacterium]|nr:hypothetical protein [Bacteroidales bacterium]